MKIEERVKGSLFGGAVGDALGAAIEFNSIDRIREKFGAQGLTDYQPAYGRKGAITDDTQMTLFTAEGLMRATVRWNLKGVCHPPSVVHHAYARWLATQGEANPHWQAEKFDGWLFGVNALHERRAPGNTCLSAMRADQMGTIEEPLNDSKGCGGVMRVAPVGLGGGGFELGCEIAALTHGHPSGYLAAGVLADLIGCVAHGYATFDEGLDHASALLVEMDRHEETARAVSAARLLAASDTEPSPESVATLGEGWVAEEALAIGVYCALVARDFEHGVLLAVNHSGDSDSTGSITGNLLGAMLGYDAIPPRWIEELAR